MTPAVVADIAPLCWMSTTDAIVFDREWLRAQYGPRPDPNGSQPSDRAQETASDNPTA